MRPDVVTSLGRSLVQHGPGSDRVYLMKLHADDMPGILDDMLRLARDKGYGKIFARVPGREASAFRARGFVDEAVVPGLHRGGATGHFMSRFLDDARAKAGDSGRIARVLELARSKVRNAKNGGGSDVPEARRLGPEQAEPLAALYRTVFETYPFSITDPDYLRRAMDADVVFHGLLDGGRVLAAASAELDRRWLCAEMTDFATLPALRGRGAAGRILSGLERAARAEGVRTAYTIARATSPGMNAVFARAGYAYAGTLCNNTHIGGALESMNVWHKRLAPG